MVEPETPAKGSAGLGDLERRRVRAQVRRRLFGAEDEVVVGRYRVLGRIGAGAMGIVYRAHDPELERDVALKVLHPDTEKSSARQSRLMREAKAMARLSHPNVVVVHDIGADDGRVYVAMELVDGPNLRGWLDAAPRSLGEILDVFVAAGRGLEAAHAHGLVHRDLKPDNILVAAEGRVRIADFGLVHGAAEPAAPAGAVPSASAALSLTGGLAGTPAYMAPEQLLGQPSDARSDQFAYCVSLFEALHRKRPFSGASVADLVFAILSGAAVQPTPDPARPAALDALVARGLRARAEDRFASMGALLSELASCRGRLGQPPAALGRGRARKLVPAIVALTVPLAAWAAFRSTDGARHAADTAPADPSSGAPLAEPPPASAVAVAPPAVSAEAPAPSASGAAGTAGAAPSTALRHAPDAGTTAEVPPPPADAQCAQTCEAYGRCRFDGHDYCFPGSDADCRRGASCRSVGQCVSNGHMCTAASISGCRESATCRDNGRCTSDGFGCVATADGCRASTRCKSDGECVVSGGSCVAPSDAYCAKTTRCKAEGRCTSNGSTCVEPLVRP